MYDLVIISDTHLGSVFSNVALLRKFLKKLADIGVRKLVFAGDIFDMWRCDNFEPFIELLDPFKGSIVYVAGNHDSIQPVLGMFSNNCIAAHHHDDILVVHGHEADGTFGKDSVLMKILDLSIYAVSKTIGFDLRRLIAPLSRVFYESWCHFTDKVYEVVKHQVSKYVVFGHSHIPHIREYPDKTLLNLGSWYSDPHAFVVQGDKYAYYAVSEDKLVPDISDFKVL